MSENIPAELHHVDCDFRNSSAAREAEETFGLPERTDIFDCNLSCNTCDAQLSDDDVGKCSDDRLVIWHGMSTPAIACGFHERHFKDAVFSGHRKRVED